MPLCLRELNERGEHTPHPKDAGSWDLASNRRSRPGPISRGRALKLNRFLDVKRRMLRLVFGIPIRLHRWHS